MSVNITLIPIAIAMYVVMGEEKFNAWVRSMENVKYTSFSNINQIKHYIISAGYDVSLEYGLIKTHFKSGNDYFCWEVREGKLCAVFSIYDDEELIEKFVSDVKKYSKIDIFSDFVKLSKSENNSLNKEPQKLTEQIFQTKFADEELLLETLKDIGFCPQKNNGKITCCSENYTLNFYKNGNENYEFKISGNISNRDAYQKFKDVDNHYGEIVQKETVNNLKEKVKQSSTMKIESEEVLEDNSVMLTISLM